MISAFNFVEVSIDRISSGDTVLHGGKLMTVSACDIKRCQFMGFTLFGDSYNLGRKPVLKGIYKGANSN